MTAARSITVRSLGVSRSSRAARSDLSVGGHRVAALGRVGQELLEEERVALCHCERPLQRGRVHLGQLFGEQLGVLRRQRREREPLHAGQEGGALLEQLLAGDAEYADDAAALLDEVLDCLHNEPIRPLHVVDDHEQGPLRALAQAAEGRRNLARPRARKGVRLAEGGGDLV